MRISQELKTFCRQGRRDGKCFEDLIAEFILNKIGGPIDPEEVNRIAKRLRKIDLKKVA